MRHKDRRWMLFWFLILILQLVSSEETNVGNLTDSINHEDPNLRSLFSPRIDYEQWKPLGRGDPLKNDPTYDYVPPVLDRVQYWVDPALRKPDAPVPGENQKTEILLLGITSKKPATGSAQADSRRDTYDPYLKYVSGSNYHPNSNQRIARPSFVPSVAMSFFPSFFSQTKNKYTDRSTFSKGTEQQRVPYTMLMPPPPVDHNHSPNSLPEVPNSLVTQKPASQIIFSTESPTTSNSIPNSDTTSSVTVQTANLVYQSSSLSDPSEWNINDNRHSSGPSSVSWPPTTTKGTIPNYREELVYSPHLAPPESYIEIEFSPNNFTHKPLLGADSNQNINYVTPPSTINSQYKEVMFKGQVSDDNMDISNTYVKIGKPEAEVHSTGFGMSAVPVKSIVQHPVPSNVIMFPHMPKPKIPPLTMQTLQEMQTMHPPPVTQSPMFMKTTNPVINILEKEKSRPIVFKDITSTPQISNHLNSPTSVINSFVTLPTTSTERLTTTTTEPTTTMTSLTTDPLFKHYKQPSEPLKGPLYLIIQGHSKVKTYGPSKQIHGILVQESNEITDDKYERNEYEVKHLHGFRKEERAEDQSRQARSGNLQTLKHVVQTGYGAIDLSGIDEVKKRSDDDFQETELQMGYEVADETEMTTERYHKGIVEEARKLKV